MNEQHELAKSVRSGERTFDDALEELLEDKLDGELDLVYKAIAYWNMGWRDRELDLDDSPLTVAEFVKEFGLEAFLPLLDRHEELEFSLGDIVIYAGQSHQVIGRREVSPLAVPRFDNWELLIEALDGRVSDFVGENDVEPLEEDATEGE